MTDSTTILIPIRYPLTENTIQTLTSANDFIDPDDDVYVLHVNIFQNGNKARRQEISSAIAPLFKEHTPTVVIRSGFLVEEVISTEATELEADVVIMGKSRKPTWRRLLSTLIGNEPAVESFLQEQTTAIVEVVE